MNDNIASAISAINESNHWLKTIAMNLAKIDHDLHKRPYKIKENQK